MKKVVLLSAIVITTIVNAQNNTLPINGNVGIGTTTPSAKLDVNGRAIIDSTLIVKDSVRFKDRLVVDKKAVFKENAVVKGNVRMENNARVLNNMRVDNNLRVFGLANLNGNVKMPNIEQATNNQIANQNIEIVVKTANGQLKTVGLSAFMADIVYQYVNCLPGDQASPMWANGINKLYSPCEIVNVGIGTASPEFKLDVRGITYSQKIKVGKKTASQNALINGFTPLQSQDLIQLGVHNSFSGGQSEVRFKITNDGTVYVKELRVRQVQNFPDYVFKTNYKLMSLYELEKYIKQYNHLPNMPTAAEVARDGASVGEIQRVLVEKVEELTLYNIQLKKENDNLQNQIDNLKNEVAEIKAMLTK